MGNDEVWLFVLFLVVGVLGCCAFFGAAVFLFCSAAVLFLLGFGCSGPLLFRWLFCLLLFCCCFAAGFCLLLVFRVCLVSFVISELLLRR